MLGAMNFIATIFNMRKRVWALRDIPFCMVSSYTVILLFLLYRFGRCNYNALTDVISIHLFWCYGGGDPIYINISLVFWTSEAYIQYYRIWYSSVIISILCKNKYSEIRYGFCDVSTGLLGFMYGHTNV